jgi:hypothetical protein
VRKFIATITLLLLVSFTNSAFARAIGMTRDLMYDAGSSANVPDGFTPMAIETAMSVLTEEVKQICGNKEPARLNWKTWVENRMSFDRQRYWIRGEFQCSK